MLSDFMIYLGLIPLLLVEDIDIFQIRVKLSSFPVWKRIHPVWWKTFGKSLIAAMAGDILVNV